MLKKYLLLLILIFVSILNCFSQSGLPDGTFGVNGKVSVNLGFSYFRVTSGCIQQDGKIIVAGYAYNTSADCMLIRFDPNGQVDNTFGINGIVFTDFSGGLRDEITKVMTLPDGSILAVGGSGGDFLNTRVWKYTSDGRPDLSFGNTGAVGLGSGYTAIDAKMQADGKLLVLGRNSNKKIDLFRINSNGIEDNGGEFYMPDWLGFDNFYSTNLYLQADQKILVAGEITGSDGKPRELFIVRFKPGGTIDSSFAVNGIMRKEVPGVSNSQMHVGNNGHLILTALKRHEFEDKDSVVIMQFIADGTADLTFGSVGTAYSPYLTSNMWRPANMGTVLQADGKIVIATNISRPKGIMQMSVQRLNTDGSPDITVGPEGLAPSMNLSYMNEVILSMNQPDGKVVLVGYAFVNGRHTVALTRLHSNGTPDLSMGNNGIATFTVNTVNNQANEDVAQCIDVLDNNKILAAGYNRNGPRFSVVLAQFNQNGSIDQNFGDGGKTYSGLYHKDVLSDFYPEWLVKTMAMTRDKQGNIYILAPSWNNFTKELGCVVLKFGADGKPDQQFGYYGRKELNIHIQTTEQPIGLVIQSDGKPVVAIGVSKGASSIEATDGIDYEALVRLNTNGSIDSTYASDGVMKEMMMMQTPNLEYGNQPNRITIQPDDKVIMTGALIIPLFQHFALRRYTKEGSIDTSFNKGNIAVSTSPSGENRQVTSVVVQADGKITTGGTANFNKLYLARFMSNGETDYSFGGTGNIITASFAKIPNNTLVEPDGKILILGRYIYDNHVTQSIFYPQIARVNEDGEADVSWGTGSDGVMVMQAPPYNKDVVGAMTFDKNGRVLVAGASANSFSDSNCDFMIRAFTNTFRNCDGYTSDFAGKDTSLCSDGNGALLGVQSVQGNTYSWSPASGLSATDIAQPLATPYQSDNDYVVKVTYPDGCVVKDTVVVSVIRIPDAFAGEDQTICNGESFTLGSEVVTDGYIYSWKSIPAGLTSADPRPVVSPVVDTRYYSTVGYGKCSSVDSADIIVTTLILPVLSKINQTLTVINTQPEINYTWQERSTTGVWGNVAPTATGTSFIAIHDGLYRVIASSGNCSEVSDTIGLTIIKPPVDVPVDGGIRLYPNPVQNSLTIDDINLSENWETLDILPVSSGQASISYNITGKTKITVDLGSLSSGYYIAVLKRKTGEPVSYRFIKL